jgi:epoxyqueuosine reductase QueG
VDLLTLSRRSDEELSSALTGSPMRRTKLQGLRRNIAVAMANAAMGSDTVSDPGSDTVSDPPDTSD